MGAPSLPIEEVEARRLAVGDTIIMGDGEYPVRAIDRMEHTVRVRLARLRVGIIDENFGSMLFEGAYTVRRVRR